jgi:ATP-dependent Zn protease
MKVIADELLVKETIEKERFEELVGQKTKPQEDYGALAKT